jgi:predicted amino acid-binding ACT domain protein
VDVVPEDATAFKNAAKPLKLKLRGPKICFLVEGDDRAGAMADLSGQLAAAKINITAVTGRSAGQGRFGAILWVKARDVRRASKAFGIALG